MACLINNKYSSGGGKFHIIGRYISYISDPLDGMYSSRGQKCVFKGKKDIHSTEALNVASSN